MKGNRWFAFRISTNESCGPSGAGSRGGHDRNPRNDCGFRVSIPVFYRRWIERREGEA